MFRSLSLHCGMPVASDGYATKVALFIDAGDRPFALRRRCPLREANAASGRGREGRNIRLRGTDLEFEYAGMAGRAIHTIALTNPSSEGACSHGSALRTSQK